MQFAVVIMSVGFIAFVTVLHIIGKVWPPRFVLHDAFKRTASLSASVCVLHQPTSLYLLALGVHDVWLAMMFLLQIMIKAVILMFASLRSSHWGHN